MKVPQNLELEDVLVWGLSAMDLLWAVSGVVIGWWLYLAVPGPLAVRLIAAAPPGAIGLAFGVLRFGELPLREWLACVAAYTLRPRLVLIGGDS